MMDSTSGAPSEWQLQAAKAQFSRVVKSAIDSGPQLVTKGGVPAVYVISARLFNSEFARKGEDRKQVLLMSPHNDKALDLTRDRDEGREVEL